MPAKKSTAPRHAAKSSTKSKKKKPLNKRIRKWWNKRSKKQKLIIPIAVFLVLVLLAVGIFMWHKLNMLGTAMDEEVAEITEEIDDLGELTNGDSINEIVKSWQTNKVEKMSSKDVKNILLIGLDSNSGCTDTMILASINTKTQKITLASFYRDSYTYIAPKSKTASYGKLNWAYSKGGIDTLISTIENNYKIEIDHYALVNYSTFPKVVDALGGVDVNVTEKEATFLNETWYEWSLTGNEVSYTTGINHLNGEKALMFCRVRRLDSDVGRAERQRRVIVATVSSLKNASVSQINNLLNAALPYIKTDMTNSEILSLASKAVTNGWLKYTIQQTSAPTDSTGKSGWAGDQWIWVVDYEGAAYELQKVLYGDTTFDLDADRVSALTLSANTATTKVSSSKTTTTTKAETTAKDETTTTEVSTTEPTTEETTTEAVSDGLEETTTQSETTTKWYDKYTVAKP